MASVHHSEYGLRKSLAGAVSWRWPRERILLYSPCRAERVATRAEWILGLVGRAHCVKGGCLMDTNHRNEEALVAVTPARLIYQERSRHDVMFWLVSASLLALALLALTHGKLGLLLYFGAGAVAVWLVGRAARSFGVGSGWMEFERIENVDLKEQRIDGLGRWGTLYRLSIPDSSDFRLIVALAGRGEASPAA